MNEEIDVGECEFKSCFDNECYSDVDSTESLNCKDNPNCYYKQLKRLETENANLKEKYQEELTVNTQLRKWQDEDLRQIAELKKDLDLFRKAHDTEQTQRRILEQKLEKIEEAITTCLTFHTCQKCKFYKECEMSLEEFILEIIRGKEDE